GTAERHVPGAEELDALALRARRADLGVRAGLEVAHAASLGRRRACGQSRPGHGPGPPGQAGGPGSTALPDPAAAGPGRRVDVTTPTCLSDPGRQVRVWAVTSDAGGLP